jgi:UDP-N-acetylmuramate dehydrogenase
MAESLADLTTLRVGGPARETVSAATESELVEALDTARKVLVLGGGSNVVVADSGFDGRLVRVATRGIEVLAADLCGGVLVRVAAGEPWDDVVAHAGEQGWAGIEALSGIPGSTGATPMQNVGAYGQEVSSTVARVRTYDRAAGALRTFTSADCGFAYRTSRFKTTDRYVIVDVTFQLRPAQLSEAIRYAELAEVLGVGLGGRVPLSDVRAAVLDLRRRKGMVLDETDHDTWSTGSFFTNPVVAQAPPGAPTWPVDRGVKTSAAWLIEQAGFARGYPGAGHRVTLSTKHTLAITNRGQGTAAEVVALAQRIRDAVHARFGIVLQPEPHLVGLTLPPVPAT